VPEVTWKGGETDLRLRGGILLSEDWARLRESALDLRAHGVLDLRMLNALARGLEAGGVARLQTAVNGTLARPSLQGDLRLQDAVVSYRPWRLRIDDLSAALTAHPGRVTVEGLSGTLNGGSLTGGGALELVGGQPRRGQVQLEIAGANVDWPEGARGLLEGTLALRGTEAGPVVAGDLLLADGAYRGDPRTLVTPKAATLGGTQEGPTLLSGLGLDVRLRTEPDVRVDNPFGTFAFSVDVTARGSAGAPRLQGQVALQPNGVY
jgi:autotransporter translocation and assembly factor TamB